MRGKPLQVVAQRNVRTHPNSRAISELTSRNAIERPLRSKIEKNNMIRAFEAYFD